MIDQDALASVERENAEAALHSHEKEFDDGDDSVLPPDPNAFPETQPEDDDNQDLRNGLYFALKDTRQEPGLSIERVASVIMTAWSREEVQSLVNELNRDLDGRSSVTDKLPF